MPVAISLLNGRRDVKDSPFSLGKWGTFLNAFAVLWVLFETVLFSMPAVIPVTETSMNYASVVFVAFGLFSGLWYLISGRHHYVGPAVTSEVEHSPNQSFSANQHGYIQGKEERI